jgi:hypothetical protein
VVEPVETTDLDKLDHPSTDLDKLDRPSSPPEGTR